MGKHGLSSCERNKTKKVAKKKAVKRDAADDKGSGQETSNADETQSDS